MTNWYAELCSVNVNDHVEKKNGLSYLSWMWAWNELKLRYPLSYATVYESPEGLLVWKDPIGAHVKTSVTIVWEENGELCQHEVTEYLPVMDFKNKSLPYENCDSMAINKTIQRSLTKCIARLGLGGYIYAGEDTTMEPEEVKQQRAAEEAEKAARIAEIVGEIDSIVKKKVKDMKQEEKVKFANEVLIPVIGTANFKACKDIEKLTQLRDKMSAA